MCARVELTGVVQDFHRLLEGQGLQVLSSLFIIADDVGLSDVTEEIGAVTVHGHKSLELIQSALNMSDLMTLPEWHSCVCEIDAFFQHPIACVRTNATGEVGYTLYSAAEGLAVQIFLWH